MTTQRIASESRWGAAVRAAGLLVTLGLAGGPAWAGPVTYTTRFPLEACTFDDGGRNRHFSLQRGDWWWFEGDEKGHVKAVHVVNVEWKKNDKGQFGPQPVPGTERVLPAQLVLLAMGFLGPEQPLLDALNIERDQRSNVKAEHEKYTTSIPGVFAAGDCRRGQSLVVWAFNEGRGAARECDRYLMGKTDLP